MRHANIPIFIPMQGCPFDCVFCDQHKITGQEPVMCDDEILQKIETHLQTIAPEKTDVQIAFFGGSFTGLPLEQQKHYLGLAGTFLKSKKVKGIRLSTRPDYINEEVLTVLKQYGVNTIELGVQSMDDSVLLQAGRGHTAEDVHRAAALIRSAGFSMVLQMMPGLPGDTFEKTLETTKQIIAMGADAVRIYPTLVIKGTKLEMLYSQKKYKPLSLDEAVDLCSMIVPLFEDAGVTILRLGLHPSEGLAHGKELIAGPFHTAFGAMVYSRIWLYMLNQLSSASESNVTITVPVKELNHAIGYRKTNRIMLLERFENVVFRTDDSLSGRSFTIQTDR